MSKGKTETLDLTKNPQKKNENIFTYIMHHKWLYIMLLPGLLYFIIFRYIPMGGIIIAFKQYSPFTGIWDSPWVGLKHFQLFFKGRDFLTVLKNTLGISLLNLIFFFPAPIILSLLLNEIRSQKYKRISQTFIYIPHFVSWVIVASLTYQLFNSTDGIVNMVIREIIGHPLEFLSKPHFFKGLIVGQSMWKETGYGTIIFLAALAGVDVQLYEAAKVDGAGKARLLWHITLPAIRSVIVLMLILRVGSLMNTGYEQIFLMENDLNRSAAEVFDTYVYTKGIINAQYSYSTAAGLFKSVVGIILVLGSNKLAKKFGETGIY